MHEESERKRVLISASFRIAQESLLGKCDKFAPDQNNVSNVSSARRKRAQIHADHGISRIAQEYLLGTYGKFAPDQNSVCKVRKCVQVTEIAQELPKWKVCASQKSARLGPLLCTASKTAAVVSRAGASCRMCSSAIQRLRGAADGYGQ